MANSPLDFPSSENFRNRLIVRNLVPYPKSPRRITPPTTYPTILSDFSVIDSPDELIDTPVLANRLYPLNEYGSNGGYVELRPWRPRLSVNGNVGEYGPQFANILNTATLESADWKALNAYGDGTNLIDSAEAFTTLEILQINQGRTGNAQPYPTTFVASFYRPVSILLSNNPRGSNGSLSQDSYIARIGARVLRKEFQDRIAREIRRRTVGRANIFNANSGTDVLGLVTGNVPLIQPNYQITVPANLIVTAADFSLRLAGSVIPLSPIPGSYFDPSIAIGQPVTTQQLQSAFFNPLGNILSGLLSPPQTGSQLFLNNTGSGTKDRLFKNLDFNRYKPGYERNIFDRLAGAIVGTSTNNSNFYVGSITSEPSRIFSPGKDLPVNEFGKQTQNPVYGPTELAQLYEGPSKEIKLGANGPIYSNGGGIEGGMTWVSPKYKGNAGKKVGVGGEVVKEDNDYKESSFGPTESTNLTFRSGSILDETQRIINSQPEGARRFQHAGNAIDQVSKIFNDGYKEMTKGSKVLSYIGEAGQEKGAEYCRVFTKDTPYLQHNDLQKTDGMTTEGRKFSYSVFDKTYNLNMYPNKMEGGQDSTNLVMGGPNGPYAKKYMFSIENLAWRTSNRPGYTVADLPVCERGPNGGRVMWFPPYGLTFSEGSSANWKGTDFLGRPEQVYTYNNTTRTGSLSWKIVVDHPSVLNLIVNKVMAKESNKARIDSILTSFFAGCRKYDLYDLAKKYYTINRNDLFEIQKEIQFKEVSTERVRYIKETLQTSEDGTVTTQISTPTSLPDLSEFKNKAVYFPNDIPKPGQDNLNYTEAYNLYETEKPTYPLSAQPFFTGVIETNYQDIGKLAAKINELLSNSENKGTITLTIDGSASAPQKVAYNEKLSQRRINSLIEYFKQNSLTKDFIDNKRLILNSGSAKGEQATVQQFNASTNTWSSSLTYSCTDGDSNTPSKEIYTFNAMACRRAVISNIVVDLNAPPVITEETQNIKIPKTQEVEKEEPYTETTRVSEEIERTVLRDNITKRVLRSLLSECDYFEVIKEETPMVFDNLKDKLKFFHPAFHSTTPEGLNARLTFLQQCLRPGDTIPVVRKEGGLEYNNATNTAFGAPPVLILRVGDFYHSKIIPDGIQLSYENLDINPEGIGIQPMIANVTMNFKFVGGHGLKEAVDKIQNSLSFNYYANTEMYDDRADATDLSYKVYDKDFLDFFNITVPPPTVNSAPVLDGQSNSDTVGRVTSATTEQSGTTGEINYQAYFTSFIDSTQNYFQGVVNKSREVVTQYNNAVLQNWTIERNYISGAFNLTSNTPCPLFGKTKNIESIVNKVFSDFVKDIEDEEEGLIKFIKGDVDNPKNFSSKVIRALKSNYSQYIKNNRTTFLNGLTVTAQELVNIQQKLITNIAKNNLITYGDVDVSGTDGYQQKNGFVTIYVTTPTNKVSDATNTDTLQELYNDTLKIGGDILDFYDIIIDENTFSYNGVTYNGVLTMGDIKINESFVFNPLTEKEEMQNSSSFQRSYFILNQEIIESTKYNSFKQKLIGNIISNPSLFGAGDTEIEREFDAYWNNVAKPVFIDENNLTLAFISEMEKNYLKNYVNYNPFTGARTKKYEFTFDTATAKEGNEGQYYEKRENLVKALGYSTNKFPNPSNWANEDTDGLVYCKVKLN